MAPKRKAAAAKGGAKAAKGAAKEEAKEAVQEAPPPTVQLPAEKEEAVEPTSKKAKVEETPEKKTPAKRGRKPKVGKAAAKKKTAAKETPKKTAAKEAPKKTEETTKSASSKLIIIEASKECNSFKVRAIKVEVGLKDAVPGLEVQVNPEKPRKGCFEIRDGEGNVFISLQSMPRPFTKLKNLDLDKTIEEIVEKVK